MSDRPRPLLDRGRWHLSAALPRLFGGTLLMLIGLVTGRFDVTVLGMPLVLSVVWGLTHAPTGHTGAALGQPRYWPQTARVEADVTLVPTAGVTMTHLRIAAPGHRDRHALIDVRRGRRLALATTTARTGRLRFFTVDHQDVGSEGVWLATPETIGPTTVLVLPRTRQLGDLPLPSRLQGLTGAHRSRRVGDGGDLRDIALFASGDRLRRIDWKATARRRETQGPMDLYVRRTFATAEAVVMLVLDSRDAVGPDVATWESGRVHPHDATSLDIARRAAGTVAAHYLQQGDRVGLVDLGRHRRPLRAAAGRRQLDLILHHLAMAEPDGDPTSHLRTPQIPSGALVVVFSTFLDDTTAGLAHTWRRSGHRTIAVDVLPQLRTDLLEPHHRTAYRIVRLERLDRLAGLAAAGVEVVTWEASDPPGADVAVELAALTRRREAAR